MELGQKYSRIGIDAAVMSWQGMKGGIEAA